MISTEAKSLDFFLPAFLCITLWGSQGGPICWSSPCVLLWISEVNIYTLKTVPVTFPWDWKTTRFRCTSPELRCRTMVAFGQLMPDSQDDLGEEGRNDARIFLEQVFVFWVVEGVHKFPETLWKIHVYMHFIWELIDSWGLRSRKFKDHWLNKWHIFLFLSFNQAKRLDETLVYWKRQTY